MKKIVILLSFLFLASCFGSSDAPNTSVPSSEYTGSGFSMYIPNGWNSSGTTSTLSGVGQWRIVLGAVSPAKKYNFSNNIVIIEDDLTHMGSSTQYSEQNNLQTQKRYFEYRTIDSGMIIFGDSDESKYFGFEAKYNNQTQKLKFVQTAKICGTKVYLLHVSMALDANISDYIEFFRTFTCK